jgi:hypothetical protein
LRPALKVWRLIQASISRSRFLGSSGESGPDMVDRTRSLIDNALGRQQTAVTSAEGRT